MSITPDDIADELLDVDEDEIEKRLAEADCLLYGLPKAIVSVCCYGADPKFLKSALDACIREAKRIQEQLAEQEAQHKDDARRFHAGMADSFEGDDYQWRVA
jgi:hypothetical protein